MITGSNEEPAHTGTPASRRADLSQDTGQLGPGVRSRRGHATILEVPTRMGPKASAIRPKRSRVDQATYRTSPASRPRALLRMEVSSCLSGEA